jgi:hypothetical protein
MNTAAKRNYLKEVRVPGPLRPFILARLHPRTRVNRKSMPAVRGEFIRSRRRPLPQFHDLL